MAAHPIPAIMMFGKNLCVHHHRQACGGWAMRIPQDCANGLNPIGLTKNIGVL